MMMMRVGYTLSTHSGKDNIMDLCSRSSLPIRAPTSHADAPTIATIASVPGRAAWPRVLAVGVAFSFLWSSAFIAGKIALASSPPFALLAMRFSLAAVLLALIVAIRDGYRARAGLPRVRVTHVPSIVTAGILNNAVYLGVGWYALQTVPAGLATLLTSVYPLVTTALAVPLLREKATWPKFAGLALGALGVFIVMRHRLALSNADATGMLLTLASVVALAAGTILHKRTAATQDFLAVSTLQVASGAAVMLIVAAATGEFARVHINIALLASLLYLAALVSIGAALMWLWLLRNGMASNASAFHFLNPLFGTALALVMLGEPVQRGDLLGGVPIAAGILLMSLAGKRRA